MNAERCSRESVERAEASSAPKKLCPPPRVAASSRTPMGAPWQGACAAPQRALLRGGADARVLRAGQAPQASEALAEGGGLVGAHEPFQLSGEAQLLLHLLAADEVMLNAGALDRKRALDKEARVPLALRGIVIGRVAAPKV